MSTCAITWTKVGRPQNPTWHARVDGRLVGTVWLGNHSWWHYQILDHPDYTGRRPRLDAAQRAVALALKVVAARERKASPDA